MNILKLTFWERFVNIIFRLVLNFFFKKFEGKEIKFIRTYPKIKYLKKGWLVSKVPGKQLYLVINEEEVYWAKAKDILYIKDGTKKELVKREVIDGFTGPLFELKDNKILMNTIKDIGESNAGIIDMSEM